MAKHENATFQLEASCMVTVVLASIYSAVVGGFHGHHNDVIFHCVITAGSISALHSNNPVA